MEITQELLKELFDYDNGNLIWKKKTLPKSNVKIGSISGTMGTHGYIQTGLFGKLYLNHRLVWIYHYGYWPTDQLDHINRIRTDNRIENLRECSNSENNQNKSMRSDNKSGVSGVSWYKKGNKWQSQLKINGKLIHLGYFDTIDNAKLVYDNAKEKYHEFNTRL